MDVTDPMKVPPPTNAPKSRTVDSGSQANVHGTARAMRVTPPIPGRKENTMARRVPATG